jgi:hypothetical protein
MVGQYLIHEEILATDLVDALVSNDQKTVLKVVVVERKDRKSSHSLELIVDTLTNTKHSSNIEFGGYIKSTGRRYTASLHKKPVGKDFGMITFTIPGQPALTLVKGSGKGGHRDNGK